MTIFSSFLRPRTLIDKIPSRTGRIFAALCSLLLLVFIGLALVIQSVSWWLNSTGGSAWLNKQISVALRDTPYQVSSGDFRFAWPMALGVSRLEVQDKETGATYIRIQNLKLSTILSLSHFDHLAVSVRAEDLDILALPAQKSAANPPSSAAASVWPITGFSDSPVKKAYLDIEIAHLAVSDQIMADGFETAVSLQHFIDLDDHQAALRGIVSLKNIRSPLVDFIPARLDYLVTVDTLSGLVELRHFTVHTPSATLTSAGSATLPDQRFTLTSVLHVADPARYISPAFSQPADLSLSFAGTPEQAGGELHLRSAVRDYPLDVLSPVVLNTAALSLPEISGQLSGNKLSGQISYDIPHHRLSNASLSLDLPSLDLVTDFVPDLEIGGSGRVTARLVTQNPSASPDFTLNGDFKNITYSGEQFSSLTFDARQKDTIPSVSFMLRSGSGRAFDLGGVIRVPDFSGKLIELDQVRARTGRGSLTIDGVLDAAKIDLTLSAKNFDLAQVPFTGLDREVPLVLTQATGKISGSLSAPDILFNGTWDLFHGHKNPPILTSALVYGGKELRLDLSGSGTGIKHLTGNVTLPMTLSLSPYIFESGEVNGHIDGDFDLAPLLAHVPMNSFRVDGRTLVRLDFAGSSRTAYTLSGDIRPQKLQIDLPDRFESSIPKLNIVKKDRTGQNSVTAALPVDLDLVFDAPNRIFVRGWGLDAELGGKLAINGPVSAPDITGSLQSIRGRYDEFGKKFSLDRAVLRFDGAVPPSPYLDIVTSTTAGDVTAQILIGGNATKPDIRLSSTPSLPEDEILSRILFGTDSGKITPFQAIQLAQALKKFSGGSSGGNFFNPLGTLRSLTGLDDITVDGAGTDGATVGAGKYITDNVYVDVKGGAAENSGSASVKIKLSPEISVESSANQNGSAGGSVFWERDY